MKASLDLDKYTKALCVCVMGLLVVALAATGWADQGSHPSRQRRYADEGNMVQASVNQVTIQKKMLTMVVTNIGDTYAIDKETIISGADGKQVRIRELAVPCKAEISYEEINGERKASRIRILQTDEKARKQWTAKQPE